jgi:hypothetical protein
MGHPFPIGMATGYSEVEIGYGEYIGYHHDSKKLFGSERSNNGTAVGLFHDYLMQPGNKNYPMAPHCNYIWLFA